MNFDTVETFRLVHEYIKELPEDFRQKMGELFHDMKKAWLRKDEYVETLEELLKFTMDRNLVERHMARKIKEYEIFELLFEEYLCMNSFDHTDEQKKEHLKAVYEMNKETYDQNAIKIAEYRDELGLDNPFSEFKPYVTRDELVTAEDVRQRIGKIYEEMERLLLPNKSDFKKMIDENRLHRSESEFKP